MQALKISITSLTNRTKGLPLFFFIETRSLILGGRRLVARRSFLTLRDRFHILAAVDFARLQSFTASLPDFLYL
jgi:hypothetical protein